MSDSLRFLIIDGYPAASRAEFDDAGMRLAWILYRDMLNRWIPDAEHDVWIAADAPGDAPTDAELSKYAGVLWPGCNLTVYHDHDERVVAMVDLVRSCCAWAPDDRPSAGKVPAAVSAARASRGNYFDKIHSASSDQILFQVSIFKWHAGSGYASFAHRFWDSWNSPARVIRLLRS